MLFMLAWRNCAWMVEEFEAIHDPPPYSTGHHEEGRNLQATFRKNISSFVNVVGQLGNTFVATSLELVALDTQNIMEESVVASFSEIREVGQTLHAACVRERLEDSSVPISDIIKRNNMLTFANRPELRKKSRKDVGVQRHNMILITQLFLSLQSRPDANMADFFRFENQREAPSLADRGALRAGKKADILQCLVATIGRVAAAQQAKVVVLDMAAIVHIVRPTRAKTFSEYVTFQIVPFLESQVINDTQRMDAVWDSYPPEDKLKAHAQQRRGNDPRTRVADGSTPILKSEWNSGFLKNEDNKRELFSFISRQICKSDVNGTLLLSTYFGGVLTNRNVCVSGLQPCNQAEADTRILLHLANAAVHGHSKACSYGGQRHCCIGAPVLRYTRAIRAVGGRWYRKEVSRHSSSLTSSRYWSVKVHRTDSVPQPNGM